MTISFIQTTKNVGSDRSSRILKVRREGQLQHFQAHILSLSFWRGGWRGVMGGGWGVAASPNIPIHEKCQVGIGGRGVGGVSIHSKSNPRRLLQPIFHEQGCTLYSTNISVICNPRTWLWSGFHEHGQSPYSTNIDYTPQTQLSPVLHEHCTL